TFAIVNVLPEPVTPSRVWCLAPALSPSVRLAIASGWSPAGSYDETSSNICLRRYHGSKERTTQGRAPHLSCCRGGRAPACPGAHALGGRGAHAPRVSRPAPSPVERAFTGLMVLMIGRQRRANRATTRNGWRQGRARLIRQQ